MSAGEAVGSDVTPEAAQVTRPLWVSPHFESDDFGGHPARSHAPDLLRCAQEFETKNSLSRGGLALEPARDGEARLSAHPRQVADLGLPFKSQRSNAMPAGLVTECSSSQSGGGT